MKTQALFKSILLISILAAAVILVPAYAQAAESAAPAKPAEPAAPAQPAQPAQPAPAPQPRAQGAGPQGQRGLFGDWDLKVQFEDREMNAIISFSRDENSNLVADWISFWGINRLQDVKFEDGKLTFLQVVQFRDEEFRSTFTGTIEEDKLTGTMSGDRGDSKIEGQRSPRQSRVLGNWDLKYKVGDMDVTAVLSIKADKEGSLSAEWKSDQVTSEVSEVNYERGTLTLKRKCKMEDRQWDSTFEATIDRETTLMTGTLKSEMGDVAVEGKRIGEALIGSWDLDITAEARQFKQRLRVNPDLSGLWGTLPIEKIDLKDGKVNFKIIWEFGDQDFEMTFDGALADGKLTGQMTSERGTQKVEGKKIVRSFGRQGQGQGGPAGGAPRN
jgi:hypothetical protein